MELRVLFGMLPIQMKRLRKKTLKRGLELQRALPIAVVLGLKPAKLALCLVLHQEEKLKAGLRSGRNQGACQRLSKILVD